MAPVSNVLGNPLMSLAPLTSSLFRAAVWQTPSLDKLWVINSAHPGVSRWAQSIPAGSFPLFGWPISNVPWHHSDNLLHFSSQLMLLTGYINPFPISSNLQCPSCLFTVASVEPLYLTKEMNTLQPDSLHFLLQNWRAYHTHLCLLFHSPQGKIKEVVSSCLWRPSSPLSLLIGPLWKITYNLWITKHSVWPIKKYSINNYCFHY